MVGSVTYRERLERVERILYALSAFSEQEEDFVRKTLDEVSKFQGGLGVTDEERRMILSAMGLQQGHWYKCPNGHIYCITGIVSIS